MAQRYKSMMLPARCELTDVWETGLLSLHSHFFAGDLIEDTGPSDDIGFLYSQLEFAF